MVGSLGADVLLPATAIDALIAFIAGELPTWRDHPDRLKKDSETALTSQLCGHLNSAARHSPGWDILQFRVEEPDEEKPGRTIDLVASPCGPTIWIDGRRCTQFDSLLPLECKRLPTPDGAARDAREYVISQHSTTGGIQRFKAGHHAASHSRAAMIGYVQAETAPVWLDRVNGWITELQTDGARGWSADDTLKADTSTMPEGVSAYRSRHARTGDLSEIDLRHIWVVLQ